MLGWNRDCTDQTKNPPSSKTANYIKHKLEGYKIWGFISLVKKVNAAQWEILAADHAKK